MISGTASKTGILIVDCGTGNLNSVKRCLDRIGARSRASSDPHELGSAEKIILPGVGHFARAMTHLANSGLVSRLNEAVLTKRIPVLGICLGMEMFAKFGEEGDAAGLGWLGERAARIEATRGKLKVPHMGWNRVNRLKPSRLMEGIDESAEFYFAHSYHLVVSDRADVLGETDYGISFPSAVERDNIFGVQFHPEKSHDAGARLLKNFVDL